MAAGTGVRSARAAAAAAAAAVAVSESMESAAEGIVGEYGVDVDGV